MRQPDAGFNRLAVRLYYLRCNVLGIRPEDMFKTRFVLISIDLQVLVLAARQALFKLIIQRS